MYIKHCEMITTVKLINISTTSQSYDFCVWECVCVCGSVCVCVCVCVVKILKIKSLNKFQVYNTVLTIAIKLDIRSPQCIFKKNLCAL